MRPPDPAADAARGIAELILRARKEFDESEHPRGDAGRFTDGGGSGGGRAEPDRAGRARRTHKPATAEKQRRGEAEQVRLARAVGGVSTDDNRPLDVLVGRRHAVEVKTLVDNDNDKVTVHPESRRRKEAYARERGVKLHTVAVDVRGGKREYYYKAGVGAFRLGAMAKVSLPWLRAAFGGKALGGLDELKEFDESEHPRDEQGRFTDGGGDGGGKENGSLDALPFELDDIMYQLRSGDEPTPEVRRFAQDADQDVRDIARKFSGIDGLPVVALDVQAGWSNVFDTDGKELPALALYEPAAFGSATIHVSVDAIEAQGTKGDGGLHLASKTEYNAVSGRAGVVGHELGHHVHLAGPKDVRKEWSALTDVPGIRDRIRTGVSEYAATNENEAFAESFAAYTHPRYAGQLPDTIHDFFARHFPKKEGRR